MGWWDLWHLWLYLCPHAGGGEMPAPKAALPKLGEESSLPPPRGNERQPKREEEKGLVVGRFIITAK